MKYLLLLLLLSCSPATFPEEPDVELATLEDVKIYMSTQAGNCYDVALMARWACDKIDMDTAIVHMYNNHEGHSICLAWTEQGRWHMFQNNVPMYLVLNMPDDWEQPILELFGDRYTRIDIEKTITHDQGGLE